MEPVAAAATLAESPLMAAGGFTTVRLLSEVARGALAHDAFARHATAQAAQLSASPDEDVRRGNPARALESALAGGGLQALYHSRTLRDLLRRLTGLPWTPSGGAGTFSYYCRAGHFLDLHRDIDACDLAVIVCVHEHGAPPTGDDGCLRLWPTRAAEPLGDIRADPAAKVTLRLMPGEALVLLGGVVPHMLTPVCEGQVRIVAPLCFRVS